MAFHRTDFHKHISNQWHYMEKVWTEFHQNLPTNIESAGRSSFMPLNKVKISLSRFSWYSLFWQPTHNQTETCSRMDKVSPGFLFLLLKELKKYMSGPKQQEGRKYWTMRTFIIFFLSATTMVIKLSNIWDEQTMWRAWEMWETVILKAPCFDQIETHQ